MSSPFRVPAPGWSLPEAYARPPLMAIGDSFLNGMRSYSITDALAACSVPAQLAAALADPAARARFRPARYPQPVLIDVEETLRALPANVIAAYRHRQEVFDAIVVNLRAWLARFAAPPDTAMPLFFDNIAIAGAEDGDVFAETAAGFQAIADSFGALAGEARPAPLGWRVPFPASAQPREQPDRISASEATFADLHIAVNGRHLLNPRNDPALAHLRAIDQVALRRPRLLLVSLGHNSGLFDITMNGAPERGLASLARYAERRWPACAALLAALPAAVERAVVQLLPLPGQVPNLMPHRKQPNAFSDGYFDTTMRAFRVPRAAGTGFYGRAEMRRWDEGVRAVNATIAAAARHAFAAAPDRLVLFDVPAQLARHDAKHGNGEAVTVTDAAGTRRFTNHGFAGYRGGAEGSVGGLGSLDNHHPSTLGYRLFAAELGAALNASLPDTVLPERLPVTDIGDTLLADPPPLAMRLLALLYAVTTEPPSGPGGGAEAPFPPLAMESLAAVMERSATAGFARIMAAPARE